MSIYSRLIRFYYLTKWLFLGSEKFKKVIQLKNPGDVSSLEVGMTIKWVNRAAGTFGVDDVEV